MNYSRNNSKVTKGVRRLVFLLVFVPSVFFSYGLVDIMGIQNFKPAYLQDKELDEQLLSFNSKQMHLTETLPLFVKMRIDGIEKYNSTSVVE